MAATVIPFAVFAAHLKRKRKKAMINTKLFNVKDILIIGAIVIIVHILVKPMLDKIGINPRTDGGSGE